MSTDPDDRLTAVFALSHATDFAQLHDPTLLGGEARARLDVADAILRAQSSDLDDLLDSPDVRQATEIYICALARLLLLHGGDV